MKKLNHISHITPVRTDKRPGKPDMGRQRSKERRKPNHPTQSCLSPGTSDTGTPMRVAVLVNHREEHVDVTIVYAGQTWEVNRFDSSGQAMAAIQCPQNHKIPAWIDGWPTIINAWRDGQKHSSARAGGILQSASRVTPDHARTSTQPLVTIVRKSIAP